MHARETLNLASAMGRAMVRVWGECMAARHEGSVLNFKWGFETSSRRCWRAFSVATFMVSVGLASPVAGQTGAKSVGAFSDKTIRLIVPSAPGGPTDVLARLVLASPGASNQPVLVDYRSGAGGLIGMELVAKSPPDGNTLLLAGSALTILPERLVKPPFDPVKDFAPIILLGTTPFVLVTNPSVPATSIRELIALAKAKPGSLQFGSAGTGVSSHLSGELFRIMAGVEILHVPYKGQGPAMNDVLGGQITFMLNNPIVALPHVRAGRLRALAVTGAKRSLSLPDVPTLGETLPGYESGTWFALVCAAGTPGEVVARLNAEVIRSLGSVEVRNRMAELGIDLELGTPEQLGQFIRTDVVKWARVIKQAGIPPE